jgi:hypothetical protein
MTYSAADDSSSQAMRSEARRIIDAARSRGLTLRLLGGLAVREHCRETAFCERPYRDIDLAGLGRESRVATALIVESGWQENRHVAMATMGRKRQFFRECRHGAGSGDGSAGAGSGGSRGGIGGSGGGDDERVHDDDRIDLYLDAFRLHHSIDLRRRLRLEPYTVSTSDVLLVKLQRTTVNTDDLRDILTVVKDAAELGDRQAPGVVDLGYLARLCAGDWGLHHDVVRNLARCRGALGTLGLEQPEEDLLRDRLDRLEAAVEAAPKRLRWRWRASFGERLAWHEPVDDVEGVYLSPAERP